MIASTTPIAALCAVALALSAPRAQVALAVTNSTGSTVASCGFSRTVPDLKTGAGALLGFRIGSTADQPYVLFASPGLGSPVRIPGIEGMLLIEPKDSVVVAGGVTSLQIPSPCDTAPAGAKLELPIPSTTPLGTTVSIQVLAGVGDASTLKLEFSGAFVLRVSC